MKMLKRATSLVIVISLLVFSLSACADAGVSSGAKLPTNDSTHPIEQVGEGTAIDDIDWPQFITFLGASAGGNAILSVSAIAQIVTDNAPTTVTAQVTAGGNQNAYLMEDGEGDFAWANSAVLYEAPRGAGGFAEKPVNINLYQVAGYNMSYIQIAVRKGSGISSIEDLRGKTVVVGAAGSATEGTSRFIMNAVGLYTEDEGYDFRAEYSGVQEGCDQIANGLADAIIVGGAIPFTSFIELFLADKIELIGYTDEEATAIENAAGGYSKSIIPAGSYDGEVEEDLIAVSILSGLTCSENVSDDVVYGVVKIMCENWEMLGTYHDMFNQITPEEMCALMQKDEIYAPIHPGAIRYYREAGHIQ